MAKEIPNSRGNAKWPKKLQHEIASEDRSEEAQAYDTEANRATGQ